jgi:hypothetical protein
MRKVRYGDTKQNGVYYFEGPEEFCISFFETLHWCVLVPPRSVLCSQLPCSTLEHRCLRYTYTLALNVCNWLQMILSSLLSMWDTFAWNEKRLAYGYTMSCLSLCLPPLSPLPPYILLHLVWDSVSHFSVSLVWVFCRKWKYDEAIREYIYGSLFSSPNHVKDFTYRPIWLRRFLMEVIGRNEFWFVFHVIWSQY